MPKKHGCGGEWENAGGGTVALWQVCSDCCAVRKFGIDDREKRWVTVYDPRPVAVKPKKATKPKAAK